MKYKILVVDDALFMRARIKKILSAIDCEIIEALNGKDACELFEAKQPDLVLLDISMPIMSGIDALEKMMEINSSIPVIMCSAVGQDSQVMNAINIGAKEFITKPFTEEQIITAVKTFLKI